MQNFLRHLLAPAIALLVALTVITGVIYPAAVTLIAQVAFPSQANGSLITVDGKTVGSSLIGQYFDQPKYFWGRPRTPVRRRATREAMTELRARAPISARPAQS